MLNKIIYCFLLFILLLLINNWIQVATFKPVNVYSAPPPTANPGGSCGNANCQSTQGETCGNCPQDCGCGSGLQCTNDVCVAMATDTPTPSPSSTNTPVPTATPTQSPTSTSTPVPTLTPTSIAAPTFTPTPTSTIEVSPTVNLTPTPTASPTPTNTPTPGSTYTPTPTPTSTSCGNGICQASLSESCLICSADCGTCTSESSNVINQITPSQIYSSSIPNIVVLPKVSLNTLPTSVANGSNVNLSGSFENGTFDVMKIEVTTDDGATWFLTVLNGSSFVYKTEPLNDGNYIMRARATDSKGNIGISDTQQLTINSYRPIIGGSYIALGPQILTAGSDGIIPIIAKTKLTFAVSVLGGVTETKVEIDKATYALTKIVGTNLWTGYISADRVGRSDVVVAVREGNGNVSKRIVGKLDVKRLGYIGPTTGSVEKKSEITTYFFDTVSHSWVPWQGDAYDQVNPVLATNQQWGLLLPSGQYYTEAKTPSYRTVQSEIFTLNKSTPVNFDFNLLHQFFPFYPPESTSVAESLDLIQYEGLNVDYDYNPEIPITYPVPGGNSIVVPDVARRQTLLSFLSLWSPESIQQATILNETSKLIAENKQIQAMFIQDTIGAVESYMKRKKNKFDYAVDERGISAEVYNISQLPFHVFIDSKGKISESYSGLLSKKLIIQKLDKLK